MNYPLTFDPEPVQLYSLAPVAGRVERSPAPCESRLHELLEANPTIFGCNWMWIGRQTRTSNGRIIDLLAIDCWGHVFGVNAHRRAEAPTVLCDGLSELPWLQGLSPYDLDAICRDYRGEPLEAALHRRFHAVPVFEHINEETGFVLVVSTKHGASDALRTLQANGTSIWMMEFGFFGDAETGSYVFTAM